MCIDRRPHPRGWVSIESTSLIDLIIEADIKLLVLYIPYSNYINIITILIDILITITMIHFMLLFSRQGKVRLQKWFTAYPDKQKKKIMRDLVGTTLSRKPKLCSFLEYKDLKIVYRRYASLYFLAAIEQDDNQLITLEVIHRYVEILDKYFGSVCELDIIFNFEKAYFILDELILGGEIQETGKKRTNELIQSQDVLQEEEAPQGLFDEYGFAL